MEFRTRSARFRVVRIGCTIADFLGFRQGPVLIRKVVMKSLSRLIKRILPLVVLALPLILSACYEAAEPFTAEEPAPSIEQGPTGREVEGDRQAIIPKTTKAFPENLSSHDLSILSDGAVLTFSEEAAASVGGLSVDDVIAIGPTDQAPEGLLRKVVEVEYGNNMVKVRTIQASLEQAIHTAEVHASISLTPNDVRDRKLSQRVGPLKVLAAPLAASFYLNIDTEDKLADGVRATGGITIDPSFDFDLVIKDLSLEELKLINTTRVTGRLELKTQIVQIDLLKDTAKVEIAHYTFWPKFIPVKGKFGIWLTPEITVYVGVDGKISSHISTAVTQPVTFHTGLIYNKNNPADPYEIINETSASNPDYDPPEFTAETQARTYVRPQLTLLIYGVKGPYVAIEAYIKLEAGPFRTPWWEIYGGVSGKVGVEIKIFSHVLARWEGIVYDQTWPIAQADTSAPVPPMPIPDVKTHVRFTLVTGGDGTKDDLQFELLDEFGGTTLYSTILTRDLGADTTEVFELVVPLDFCDFSSFRLTKLTGPDDVDDHWFLDELFLEVDGEMVFFDRAAGDISPITASSFPYMGGYSATVPYMVQCGG